MRFSHSRTMRVCVVLCAAIFKIDLCFLRFTQEALAAKLQIEGVTMERDSLSRIEIGTRFVTDYELKVLAKVLGVSSLWLLDDENE